MKRILIVPTLGLGLEGITSVIYNYIHAMDRQDLQLHFMTYGDLQPALRDRFSALGTIEVVSNRKQSTAAYVKDYMRLLRAYRFDVVHIHGNSGTMAIETVLAKLCGVPKVLIHTHSTKTDHPLVNAILKYPMMVFADKRIACARGSGAWLYGNWKHTVLNNAIDLSNFRFQESFRAKYRDEFGINGEFVVGHAGHFSEQKNHFFLIDVFAEFHKLEPGSKLLLISGGPRFQQVKEKVAQLGLEDAVIFAGFRSDLAGIYSAMDLFILPSCWEGLPLVLVEAQASGLPVIASDRITKDVRCTQNFWYLPIEEDPKVWAEKLREVSEKKIDRTADTVQFLREHGFDIHTEADRLLELYLN